MRRFISEEKLSLVLILPYVIGLFNHRQPRCTEDGEARYTQLNRQYTTKRLVYNISATRLQWTEEGEGSLGGSRAHHITTFLSKPFFSNFSLDR